MYLYTSTISGLTTSFCICIEPLLVCAGILQTFLTKEQTKQANLAGLCTKIYKIQILVIIEKIQIDFGWDLFNLT